ncbi:MAG: uracil-DNA glycosylase [Deltaproteobacteria bacterium]|nr:uracil-DNA glycosylase [Deltaproteobacteria bacterium]
MTCSPSNPSTCPNVSSNPENELAAVISSAQELLRWEETLGGQGFPAPKPPSPHETPLAGPGARGSDQDIQPRLQVLADEAAECTRCELSRGRTKSVFARGTPDTDLVFVGEGPGFHEDQQGLPFVGRAGQLLDRMVAAMGYDRDGVYICNVVKCRPPDNRTPLPVEAAACAHFLIPQLDLVRPKTIVALGRCAAENLNVVPPAGRWRGIWGEWRGIPVMPTYHPAFLLRSPQFKKPVWEDLQEVLKVLNRAAPKR